MKLIPATLTRHAPSTSRLGLFRSLQHAENRGKQEVGNLRVMILYVCNSHAWRFTSKASQCWHPPVDDGRLVGVQRKHALCCVKR